LQHFVKKDGRYTCEPFEFAIASLDEIFVFHLGIVNLQDIFARGLFSGGITYYTMGKMTDRLCEAFDKGVEYTSEEQAEDIEDIKKEMPEVYDAIFRTCS